MLTPGALEGVRVLDLSRLLPGPYCSMILADHGAKVIAIEDKRFLEDDFFIADLYRNKRHMSLNLKSSTGREIFYRMAEQADVIMEGFRPGVVKRIGVDYNSLKAIKPDIIYCSITGYGQTGPMNQQAGHDVNYLAKAGVLDLIGTQEAPPSIPGVQIADIAGGAMQAAIGILLALYRREKSGEGQYIDISMTDGLLGLLTLPNFLNQKYNREATRSDSILSHRYACYNTYFTSDKRTIAVGALENRFWKQLCEILGRSDYSNLQYNEERREEVISWLKAEFAKHSAAVWKEKLATLDACVTIANSLGEVFKEKQFIERETVVDVQEKGCSLEKTFGVPVKLSATPGSLRTPPSQFGQHTSEILQEIGYSSSDIQELIKEGVC